MNRAVESNSQLDTEEQFKEALYVWGIFIILAILINGTIPFVLEVDLHTWTNSSLKSAVFNFLIYGGLFLVVPLGLTKGWATIRRPEFLLPLSIAVLAITLRAFFRPTAALAVIIIIYLHWHFDLSQLGIRSFGWKGDIIAILLFGLLYLAPSLMKSNLIPSSFGNALLASLDRMFLNPASTTEYLFYFAFLTERLSHKTGRWMTPWIVAAMYTTHEMSNPEYWYEGMNFAMVFIGVALMTGLYLWRRSIVVSWLGDGLGRFVSHLFISAG